MSSLDLWLQHHGTNLKSLRIETAHAMPAALPCPDLEDLQLPVCRPGSADMMSAALQELSLHAAPGSPARASAHLGSPVSPSAAAAQRAGYLQQLPHLTALAAPGGLSDADLHKASTLTNLRQLSLRHLKHARPACIAGMLQELRGLVWLQLADLRCNLSASTTPGVVQLTKLRHLRCVVSKVLEPALLQDMTELEHLSLSRVKLQASGTASSAGDKLLDLLPQLQELTHLTLSNIRGFDDSHAAAYAGLTSSSKLQHLGLHRFKHNGYGGVVWEHVFGTQLPQLFCLDLSNVCPQLLHEDLDSVNARCPGLRELNMVAALDAASCLMIGLPGEVTRLSALLLFDGDVRLGLNGNTRLQFLYGACSGGMAASTIEGLASLRQLTSLTLEAGGVPGLVDNYPPAHKYWYKAFLDPRLGPRHFVSKVTCASS